MVIMAPDKGLYMIQVTSVKDVLVFPAVPMQIRGFFYKQRPSKSMDFKAQLICPSKSTDFKAQLICPRGFFKFFRRDVEFWKILIYFKKRTGKAGNVSFVLMMLHK